MKILRLCLLYNRQFFINTSQSKSIGRAVQGIMLILLTWRPSGLLFFHLYVPLASLHSKSPFQSLKARGTLLGQSWERLASNHPINQTLLSRLQRALPLPSSWTRCPITFINYVLHLSLH